MKIGIEGVAYSLGSNQLTNSALNLENPSWEMAAIQERSGVSSRPVAGLSETALDMGERAAKDLLEKLGLLSEEFDALIFCSQTPDYILPPNSSLLHARLGMTHDVMAFDITHACSGFVYGLGIGNSLVQSGTASRILLITADTYTRLIHPEDRSTRPIFGDGAAATVISAIKPAITFLDMAFGTAGKYATRFIIKNGGSRYPKDDYLKTRVDKSGRILSDKHIFMDGLGLLSFFSNQIPKAVNEILFRNRLSIDDISLFVFHQASKLALDGLQRNLRIPKEKMYLGLRDFGNLVSASIPVSLASIISSRKIQPGQLMLLSGFGVGLSWGTILVRVEAFRG
jgi:3-oxoacyl-[acyl-carrier-protein] synthase-3